MAIATVAPRRDVHAQILDAAAELFYTQGIRAVSADRLIERVGVSKVTFYRHFRSKDDLVVEYLLGRAAWERAAVDAAFDNASDAAEAFTRIAERIGAESCRPGFRGCPFINAAAEYADPAHPVRAVVAEHREWFVGRLAAALAATVADPRHVAERLVMLRDGAMVAGYLGQPERVADQLVASARAVIDGATAA
jgi:AcrR family transcriptional regulator